MRASRRGLLALLLLGCAALGQNPVRVPQAGDRYLELIDGITAGDPARVVSLLQAGAPPDAGDRAAAGMPVPIILAAKRGEQAIVQALLNAKANPNIPGSNGGTALFYAVDRGFMGAVRVLLDGGANPNACRPEACASTAVRRGFADILDLLLKAGADPNRAGANAPAPLLLAVQSGRLDLVQLLLSRGARAGGWTRGAGAPVPSVVTEPLPLHVAIQLGHARIVQALLEAGADVGVAAPGIVPAEAAGKMSYGASSSAHTPLGLAQALGHVQIAQLVRQAAAKRGNVPAPPLGEVAEALGHSVRVLARRLAASGVGANALAGGVIDSLEVLAQSWQPGSGSPEWIAEWAGNLQLMQTALDEAMLRPDIRGAIAELNTLQIDLRAKAEHCLRNPKGGLGGPVKVLVHTVAANKPLPGLAVCWKPAIMAARKEACFRDFSSPTSPAEASMVPGIYLISVRDPQSGKHNTRPATLEIGFGKSEFPITIPVEW